VHAMVRLGCLVVVLQDETQKGKCGRLGVIIVSAANGANRSR